MTVVIVLEGALPSHFTVAVSPLAELAASLHVLTEYGHHADRAPWAEAVVRDAPEAFRDGLRRFSPLWAALRWRGFYAGLDPAVPGGATAAPGTAAARTPAPARLSLDAFAELTAYSCASGYLGFAFDRLLHEPRQAAALRRAASGLPEPHLALAEDLLRDARRLRSEVLGFLDLCRPVFFGALWAETGPLLAGAAHRIRQRLADEGPALALGALSPSGPPGGGGPPRVVFDKVHHAVITPVRTPVLLIPTLYGAPHLIVKNEPGLPPVVHFPVGAPVVGVTLARRRMLALTDPRRVRLCRLIARQSMTTADLAHRLSMTRPQVSRHLRALRDLGLVRTERQGRYVLYGLDVHAVERIGQDVATALQF
ncbi:hypothetical protein GCM10010387_03230 [Streptomyces inusitatus]|uniref:HTH arsR-type domain-containing protein n=1 Tax=Streptomyces inusitatus TaxID=68221 RepID=A0A918PKZ2_9ACTN|nr:DUF5937 family protein [Streptomyces inusitatus]GGZ14473.1 hypothetical protein GCM10010387_03230 [Streptomyces inusitatus]